MSIESLPNTDAESTVFAIVDFAGLEWKQEGNCLGVDPDLFFPERGASTREAKEVCRGCIVRLDCLEFALDNFERFGIWGGMSERERRRVRRQRIREQKVGSVATPHLEIVPDSSTE